MSNTTSKTRVLIEGALMIAVATILSYIKLFEMPFGGSITLEMLPLVLMGLRNGVKPGCFTGFVHGLLQMIIGFSNVMYCATLISQVGCILLDYLLAFMLLGTAGMFAKVSSNRSVGIAIGACIAGLLRFACSFLSGWLLWGSYAPEGMNAAYYSLVYNGAYMVPDIIILVIVILLIFKAAPKLFEKQN